MKKILKNMLALALVLVLAVSLSGCGKGEPNANTNNGGNKKTGGSDLENVSTDNYKSVAKSLFGLDVKDYTGWTIKKAESPNGVNNLNLEFTISNGSDAKTIIKEYFEECKKLSGDGLYAVGYNDSYTRTIKKDKYTDFDTFFSKEGTNIRSFYQAKWIYNSNGKDVQYHITIESNSATIAFVFFS